MIEDGAPSAGDPASIVTGDLRWVTIGDLIEAFGALVGTAGELMATQGAESTEQRRLIDEFINRLGSVSAAVDFTVGFLDLNQRCKVRERFREERNKMQHAHWHGRHGRPMPPT